MKESEKNKYWDIAVSEIKAKDVTKKRLEKLKPFIWDNDHFWFLVERKPEEIPSIVREKMYITGIIKR